TLFCEKNTPTDSENKDESNYQGKQQRALGEPPREHSSKFTACHFTQLTHDAEQAGDAENSKRGKGNTAQQIKPTSTPEKISPLVCGKAKAAKEVEQENHTQCVFYIDEHRFIRR